MSWIDFSGGYPRFGVGDSPINFANGYPRLGPARANFPVGAQPANAQPGAPMPESPPLPPNPEYQNPGAALLPDFTPVGQATGRPAQNQNPPANPQFGVNAGDLPPPAFASPPLTNPITTMQPGQFSDLVRRTNPGSLFSGGSGAPPAVPPPSAGLPSLFNAGAPSQDVAYPASMFPGGPPPGFRQQISADGNPGHYEAILPGERGAGGIDTRRQGLSLAEIMQANPHLGVVQAGALQRNLQTQATADAMRTRGLQTDQRNMGQGLFTDAQRTGVGQYGVDPRTGGGAAGRAVANEEERTRYTTGGQQAIDQAVNAYIAANPSATAEDISEFTDALRRGRTPGGGNRPATGSPSNQPATGNFPITPGNQPVVQNTDQNRNQNTDTAARNPIHRELDQHLGTALVTAKAIKQEELASRRGVGSRVPLTMPATTDRSVANDAITNFVSSLGGAGRLTPETLPEIMSYMNQRFGATHTNNWFQHRFGVFGGGAHQEGVNSIMNLANERGANVGFTDPGVRGSGGFLTGLGRTINGWFQ